MNKCVKHITDFLGESETFAGITFTGMYTINQKDFLIMLEQYIKTGENYLDEYSDMTHMSWSDWDMYDHDGYEYLDKKERKKIKFWFSGNSFWNFDTFITSERKKEIEIAIILSEKKDHDDSTYKSRRKKASSHTNKKSTRAEVFNIHGECCNVCGSTHILEIDHIIPVSHGGSNDIKNLQPLCKSCNASKGNKVEHG